MVSGHHDPALTVASFDDDDDFPSLHDTDPGDDAGARRLPVILVVGDQQPDLDPGCAGIAKLLDAFAGGELALAVHLGDALGAAALLQAASQLEVLVGQGAEPAGVRTGTGRRHVNPSGVRRPTPGCIRSGRW